MTKERVKFVENVPVEKGTPHNMWVNHTFRKNIAYEISNRELRDCAREGGSRLCYRFELWDDQGLIGTYQMLKSEWDQNVKRLSIEVKPEERMDVLTLGIPIKEKGGGIG